MIVKPGVKVIEYPADNAIRVTWDYLLDGKPSPLTHCRVRLGRGDEEEKVMWTSCLDCRGNYQNGHVEEYLEEADIPNNDEGKNIYAQFLVEPMYVLNDETRKIEENHEGELVLSSIVTLISLAAVAKLKALSQNAIKQGQIKPSAQA